MPPADTARHRLLRQWTAATARHAVAVVLLFAAVTAGLGWYTARNLSIKTSTTDMISEETPFRRNAIAFDTAFPQFDDLIVAVIDAPSDDTARAAAVRFASELKRRPDLFSRVAAPALDPFFQRHGLLFYDVRSLEALADRLAQAEPFLAALAQQPDLGGLFDLLKNLLGAAGQTGMSSDAGRFLNEIAEIAEAQVAGRPAELSWRTLFDQDREARQLLVIQPKLAAGGFAPAGPALAEIRRQSDAISNRHGSELTIRLTGSPAIDHEELQSVQLGGKTSGLLSLTLVVVLLVVGLRSWRLVVPTLACLIAGLVWTAAFAALAIGHLNLISVAFAVLFIGLGVDFSIHYCLRFREYAGGGDALPRAAASVGGSLAICAFCAAIGFLSFVPTDYRGLAELGLISGAGMAIALFTNTTLLPALLALCGGANRPAPPLRQPRTPATHRYRRQILLCAIFAGVSAVAIAPFARFDFNPLNLKDPASESVAAFLDLAKKDGAVYAIDVLAADLKSASREAARLRALSEVGRVVTLESFVPDGQAEKLQVIEEMSFFLLPALSAAPTERKIAPAAALRDFTPYLERYLSREPGQPHSKPAERLLVALRGLSDAEAAANLERRLLVNLTPVLNRLRHLLGADSIGIESLPESVRNDWIAANGAVRVQAFPAKPIEDNVSLQRFASAILKISPRAVGTPITITEAGAAVVAAFREATAIAFILVVAVLLAVLRRLSDTCLVLAPLMLAALLTGATSVVAGLPFNFANVIVLPLLFGLGVASGVHLVVGARRTGDTTALLRSSTPRAVLFSALTTIASFGSLALSGHRGMTSMGQLLTIAIAITLLCTLIVLPAMLAWLETRRG